MKNGNSSVKWILGVIGISFTVFLYLICCFCSIHKIIKDRKRITENNCAKRNKKYLKEVCITSEKSLSNQDKAKFAISKNASALQSEKEKIPIDQTLYNSMVSTSLPTKSEELSSGDIEEILNESHAAAFTNSSFFEKSRLENSELINYDDEIDDDENKSIRPIVTSLRKPKIIETIPKVYYLKAHNFQMKENDTPTDWVSQRINNESSFVNAQPQPHYGFKRAPLAKQNSGFSSMDDNSTASQF